MYELTQILTNVRVTLQIGATTNRFKIIKIKTYISNTGVYHVHP